MNPSGRETEFRLLHLISTLSGGGAERQLTYLASELARIGVEVHVGCLRPGPNVHRFEEVGVTLHQLPAASAYDPRIASAALSLMKRLRISVVQTWLTQMDVLGGAASLLARVPFILSERSAPDAYSRSWKSAARWHVGARAAAIVANSDGGLGYWRRRPPRSGQLRCVIPNAVPFEEIAAAEPIAAAEVSQADFRELIVIVGRLIPIKNVGSLIPALVEVLRTRADAVAVFLGEGAMHDAVLRAAARARLSSRLIVKGYSVDVFQWLKLATLYVSASAFEGNPNSVLEAAAARCPLVLSDIPAHREVFDERAARFVVGRDPASIAHGILEVLDRPEPARARAVRALAAIQDRRVEMVAQRYLDLYRQVLS